METTLYADVLFIVNFSMDFISLWAAATLMSSRRSALKMSAAAAIGAVYGVISVVIGLDGILMYISAAAVSVLMCAVAFGKCGSAVGLFKHSALIWGCGALLGGIMSAVINLSGSAYTAAGNKTGSPAALIAAATAALLYITVRLMRSAKKRRSVSVTVSYKNASVTFSALCDSGNLLCDPISGDPVIAVSAETVKRLTGIKICNALTKKDTEALSDLRLPFRIIPHSSAGGSDICFAFLPEKVTVSNGKDTREVRCLIAPMELGETYFGGFAATLSDELTP